MTTIYHPSHPHYAVHKAFIEGSFANPDNPPVVQIKGPSGWGETSNPGWIAETQYRIKPRLVTRTVTYPEPLRGAPVAGTLVWLMHPQLDKPYRANWDEKYYGRLQTLKNGMVFATEADAQQCYDALFGEQK